MATITIQVTQDDIDKGERKQRCRCPVWRAINRAAPYLDRLQVIYLYATCRAPAGDSRVIQLPEVASNFIHCFDGGLPGSPLAFDLDVPDDLIPAVTP